MALLADFRRRAFARMYDRATARYEVHVAERRRKLCAEASGTVLELGPGTGANLPYLSRPAGSGQRVTRWIGLEPNPHMHPFLLEKASALGLHAEVRGVTAEGMQVDDESVDTVIATLVLCSVAEPERVVADVLRVLKPGGRFVFLEHVAAPAGTFLRRAQTVVRPAWRFLCDGCRPDRETAAVLSAAGFGELRLEEFRLPRRIAYVVAPHIAGVATK